MQQGTGQTPAGGSQTTWQFLGMRLRECCKGAITSQGLEHSVPTQLVHELTHLASAATVMATGCRVGQQELLLQSPYTSTVPKEPLRTQAGLESGPASGFIVGWKPHSWGWLASRTEGAEAT